MTCPAPLQCNPSFACTVREEDDAAPSVRQSEPSAPMPAARLAERRESVHARHATAPPRGRAWGRLSGRGPFPPQRSLLRTLVFTSVSVEQARCAQAGRRQAVQSRWPGDGIPSYFPAGGSFLPSRPRGFLISWCDEETRPCARASLRAVGGRPSLLISTQRRPFSSRAVDGDDECDDACLFLMQCNAMQRNETCAVQGDTAGRKRKGERT
jgi:hypothetical protein